MPPGGGQTTTRSRRAARRRTPPPPRPSAQNAQAYVSQGRAVAHVAHQQRAVARAQRATRTAAPLSPRTPPQQRAAGRRSLGFQPHLGDLHPAQRAAVQRARRATQRVSPRPMPHVPVLQNPTRHQAQVAHDLIARAINAQTTGRTGAQRQASRNAVIRDIQTDPRLRDVKRASSHYARALERRNSIVIARGSQPSQQSVAADLRRIAGGVARMPGVRPLSSKPVTPKLAGSRAQMMEGLKQAAISYGSKDAGGLGLSQRSQNIRAGRAQSRYARATNQYKALAAPKPKVLALGPASLNVTPAVTAATKAIGAALAQTSLNTGDLGPRNLGQKTVSDVKQIATGPFVGLYGLSQGLYDLQSGNSRRLSDLAAGTAKGTAETFTHPVRSFQRNPLITALTFAGGVGAAGRVAGALARGAGAYEAGGLTGGARAALARAGSDIRPPVAYSADAAKAGIRERRYSRDIIRKSVQVANDARREPLRHVTYVDEAQRAPLIRALQQGRDMIAAGTKPARGSLFEGETVESLDHQIHLLRDRGVTQGPPVTVKYGHREVPVLAPRGTGRLTPEGDATRPGRFSEIERQGRKTGDYLSASQQSAEYHMRDAANRAFALKGVKGQHAKDLVAMVAEGTVRSAKTFEQDLRSYRDMVQGEITRHEAGDKVFRTSKEVREAQAQVARIDRILGDKRVASQIDRIVAAGEDIGKRLNEGEAEAQLHGLMDPTRARRAALIHPAILHMGAKHFTPEEMQALGGQFHSHLLHPEDVGAFTEGAAYGRTLHHGSVDGDGLTRSGFDFGKAKRHTFGHGVYASSDRAVAERYGKVVDVAVHFKKPLNLNDKEGLAFFTRTRSEAFHELEAEAGHHLRDPGLDRDVAKAVQRRHAENLRKQGFDGIIANDEHVALTPTAIRVITDKAPRRGAGADLSEEALAHGALRGADGRFLSNRDIETTLREAGRDPRTVAYLPPGAIGRSAFHRRFNISRPTVGGGKHARTGEQYRRGLTRAGETSVREQGVKLAVVTQKGRGVDRVISEHGMLHPTGRYFTGKEAEEYAKRLADETGERLTPVSAFPAKATAEMQKLAKGEQSVDAMENLSQRLLNDRVAPGPNAKNVVLVPSSIVERLQEHAAPTTQLVKLGQWINKPFRAAVLPQPRWLAGNVVEPGIRLTMRGSGVNVVNLGLDITATNRILKSLKNSSDASERALYHHLEGQIGQGLFVGGRNATVRRTLEEMPGHDTWGPMIQRLPIMRTMVEMGRTLGHGVMAPANLFFKANRVIENVANRAEFGRNARRDIQSFTGSWTQSVRLGDKAVAEAKRGLMNTPTQRRFAETAYETLGKYTGFNPTMRALTQTIMPFIPWMLNAARFVFWTMPAHHTVKTALLQQASQSMQKDWQDIHKDTPPGNLRFAIPNGKGGWVDIARYTPWGAFTEAAGGGGGKTFTGQILPQLGGVTGALEGKDPFGRDLSAPPGKTPNPTKIAINSALEAMVPYAATIRRLREGGATGYSTSTALHPETKPGTKHSSAVARTFSPINPTYLRAPTGGAGGAPADPRAVRRAQRSAARAGGSTASLERALKRARRAAGK